MSGKRFPIPVMAPRMEPVKREYPISPKENFLRVLRHEKPMWMPAIYQSTQWIMPSVYNDMPPLGSTQDGEDWFGTKYKYEAAQQGVTPMPGLFDEICEWREKVKWPDIASLDWKKDNIQINPDLASATRIGNGNFERLHMSEGFEQALCDILLEPDECKAFFDRMGEYKIELFNRINNAYPLDMLCQNDDWGNARAPFFSNDTFEATLLDSAVALADTVHKAGCGFMLHCCGMMEAFLPYIVNDIKADILEIQPINDIRMILDKYGAKTSPIFRPNDYIMYDPELTPEQAREYARSIVDKYGAHTCEGSGCLVNLVGSHPASYYAFEDEIFNYSLERYASLSR